MRKILKRVFVNHLEIWISIFTTAFLLTIGFILRGIYPTGEKIILGIDLDAQYAAYYEYFRRVLQGTESLFYSWSRNLSGEFLGLFAYYLASPFTLIITLLPRELLPDAVLIMVITKVAVSSGTMAVYLSKKKKVSKWSTCVFSVLYSLSYYVIEQTYNPMWLDAVIIFPLLIYAVEEMIDNKKYIMYVITITYAFMTCFYMGYMMGIFIALYFLTYYFATYSIKEVKRWLFAGLRFIGATCLSLMISSIILVPAVNGLSNGKFDFGTTVDEVSTVTSTRGLWSFIYKFLPYTFDTGDRPGYPGLYCGAVVFILLVCYFFSKRYKDNHKIAYASLFMIMFASMYVRTLDMLWHGGQDPNWFPFRYTFMISFVAISLAAQMFDKLKTVQRGHIVVGSSLLLASAVLVEIQDDLEVDSIGVLFPAVITVCIITFVLILTHRKINVKKSATIVLCAFIGLECFFNMHQQMWKQSKVIWYQDRAYYTEIVPAMQTAMDILKSVDTGTYRVGGKVSRSPNDSMALGTFGIQHSSSTLNSKAIYFLHQIGFGTGGHVTYYKGANPINKSLLGFKYEYDGGDIKIPDDVSIIKNKNAMPMMYLVDNTMDDVVLTENDIFYNQNYILSSMVDKDYTEYFKKLSEDNDDEVAIELSDIQYKGIIQDHRQYSSGSDGVFYCDITMPSDGDLYFYLQTKWYSEVDIYLDEELISRKYHSQHDGALLIGKFKAGDTPRIEIHKSDKDMYVDKFQFAVFDEELFTEDINALKELNTNTSVEFKSNTDIVVTAASDTDMTLFTGIPEERGWTVYVDGVETPYFKMMDALIGVNVPRGPHTVELIYTPVCFPIISIIGIVLFVLMILSERLKKQRLAKQA